MGLLGKIGGALKGVGKAVGGNMAGGGGMLGSGGVFGMGKKMVANKVAKKADKSPIKRSQVSSRR